MAEHLAVTRSCLAPGAFLVCHLDPLTSAGMVSCWVRCESATEHITVAVSTSNCLRTYACPTTTNISPPTLGGAIQMFTVCVDSLLSE